MTIIKSFLLCITVLSSFNIFAMRRQLTNLEVVWNKIDKDYVGMSDCALNSQWHLRSFVGSCLSYGHSFFMTPETAKKELNQILNNIPSSCDSNKEYIVNRLLERHWYVQYLVQCLADQKARELEDITGSNVINRFRNEKKIDSIVFSYACNKFLNKSLLVMMPENISDIHFIALEHPNGNVNPSSLAMSGDGKYLRATSDNGTHAVWEMETATLVNGYIPENCISWKKSDIYADYSHKKQNIFGGYSAVFMERYRVISQCDQYCAMPTNAYMAIDPEFLPKEVAHNPRAIILFKKPEATSYFCQEAFDNSYTNSAELIHLLNSNVVQSMKGFPRKNLERVGKNRIEFLAKNALPNK